MKGKKEREGEGKGGEERRGERDIFDVFLQIYLSALNLLGTVWILVHDNYIIFYSDILYMFLVKQFLDSAFPKFLIDLWVNLTYTAI